MWRSCIFRLLARSSKSQITSSNEIPMNQVPNQAPNKKPYDLEERTAQFGEAFIDLAKKLPRNPINNRLIDQGMGSVGSMGANYCEANEAESRTDFVHKIGICKKETKETKHWIRLLARANPEFTEAFRKLWQETEELLLIFSTILKNAKKNREKLQSPRSKFQ